MPLLGPADRLTGRPRRILVAGTSGSGKTTLARRIAQVLQVPHIEIDALYHGPGWTPRPEFEADVAEFVAWPAWVTEWQYDAVRPMLIDAADLLVWLDLRRRHVMWQVSRRTARRSVFRTPLWNGNIEPPLRTLFTDREHIMRWAWRTHPLMGDRIAAVRTTRPDLTVVRLADHRAADRWVGGPLTRAAVGGPTSA